MGLGPSPHCGSLGLLQPAGPLAKFRAAALRGYIRWMELKFKGSVWIKLASWVDGIKKKKKKKIIVWKTGHCLLFWKHGESIVIGIRSDWIEFLSIVTSPIFSVSRKWSIYLIELNLHRELNKRPSPSILRSFNSSLVQSVVRLWIEFECIKSMHREGARGPSVHFIINFHFLGEW